jgi:hypothetical protein
MVSILGNISDNLTKPLNFTSVNLTGNLTGNMNAYLTKNAFNQ